MDLCQTCHEAVRLLFPRAKNDVSVRLNVQQCLPQLNHATFNNCWICHSLAQWLKIHKVNMLSSWQRAPLPVTYTYVGSATARFPPFWFKRLATYLILIVPKHTVTDDKEPGAALELACIDKSMYRLMLKSSQQSSVSEIDFDLVRKWIARCSSSHTRCGRQKIPFLPSRLIKIGTDGKTARLISTKAEFGDAASVAYQSQQYITLSHRWSSMSYKKLYVETLHDLEREIVVSELPRVFQDAFIMVTHLGFTLLWIDSLCIMQDPDSDDLKLQCPLMHKIYAAAFLNISATGCEDNQGHMLKKRMHPTNPKPQTFKARYSLFSRRRYIVEGNVWIDEIANAPLHSRGWVFQERHLARRVLHLGSNLMAWECRELDALETCPDGLPRRAMLNTFAKGELFQSLEDAREGSAMERTNAYDTWRSMVDEYSHCSLTFPKDRLPAIKGLAAYFGDNLGANCVAGAWSESLAFDLTWSRDPDASNIKDLDRAPSWSWASMDGGVTFPSGLTSALAQLRVSELHFSKLHDTAATKASPEDRKSVSMKAHMFELQCSWKDEEITGFRVGNCAELPVFEGSPCNSICIDGSIQKFKACEEMKLVVLACSGTSIHGLVLSKLPDQLNGYQRLGSVEIAARFPFSEINGKKVVGTLPGRWGEYYYKGSRFPWKARRGPILCNMDTEEILIAMNKSQNLVEVVIH